MFSFEPHAQFVVNPPGTESRNLTPRELVDKYSGQGLQFRVKVKNNFYFKVANWA